MGDLAHIERLMAIHLGTVIAEGITEPGAALTRMVELDNDALDRLFAGSVAYDRFHETGERVTVYRGTPAAYWSDAMDRIVRLIWEQAREVAP